MAGGKGKSSGGKSSGGKVGVDGSKKQQSHSSKAGLQVSIAHVLFLHPETSSVGLVGVLGSRNDPGGHGIQPHTRRVMRRQQYENSSSRQFQPAARCARNIITIKRFQIHSSVPLEFFHAMSNASEADTYANRSPKNQQIWKIYCHLDFLACALC
jgi:hypothetical protein